MHNKTKNRIQIKTHLEQLKLKYTQHNYL